VILSNPPWERIKLQEQEFFAARDARIATAPTKAARGRLIRELPQTNPTLYREYLEALRSAGAASQFLRHSGRFPLTGRGDINTYAVFAELARSLLAPGGRAGIIVPTGIATDDTTKFFFQAITQSGTLASLYDFENRKGIFPAVHKSYKFSLLTMRGADAGARPASAEFVFFALSTEDLKRPEKRFSLSPGEIALLNPNTGNCPIFRTQADAELTKAIYRRVPILWREASEGQPEANPWRLSFKTLFHMANDSHHFRTAAELEAAGYRREGNLFLPSSPPGRGGGGEGYLPLYEAKMLHQFDHRWATHEHGEDAREVSEAEKRDPHFVVQPRYWVREEVVESAIPHYPEPLAVALRLGRREGIRRVLAVWAAGYHLRRGEPELAQRLLATARSLSLHRDVARALGHGSEVDHAQALAHDFPLTEADVRRIAADWERPEALAQQLVDRFSPKWFLGWRRICRSTDERTLIAFAQRATAAGDSVFLLFPVLANAARKLALLAVLDSLVLDYVIRQKLGGTNANFYLVKQLPVISPELADVCLWEGTSHAWVSTITERALELVYTAWDLQPLARDLGDDGPPFAWDPERRFQLRCELDAVFFHLYLPATREGQWRPARVADGHVVDERDQELTALKSHFPTPAMPWRTSWTNSRSSDRRTRRSTAAIAPGTASSPSTTPCRRRSAMAGPGSHR
jgi:hypothetical protein